MRWQACYVMYRIVYHIGITVSGYVSYHREMYCCRPNHYCFIKKKTATRLVGSNCILAYHNFASSQYYSFLTSNLYTYRWKQTKAVTYTCWRKCYFEFWSKRFLHFLWTLPDFFMSSKHPLGVQGTMQLFSSPLESLPALISHNLKGRRIVGTMLHKKFPSHHPILFPPTHSLTQSSTLSAVIHYIVT